MLLESEMTTMEIKYVYTEDGKISDVIVPIDIWNQTYCRTEESEQLAPWDPSEFFGSIKHAFSHASGVEIERKMRDEWDRL